MLARLLLEADVAWQRLVALRPGEQLLRRLPDDVVLRLGVTVWRQRPVRNRLDEQDDAPDVVDAEPVTEVFHRRSRPTAQDPVVEIARAGVAAAAGVICAREVCRRRREERRAGPAAVALQQIGRAHV